MTRIYAKVLAAASAIVLSLTLPGCVNEDSPCDIPSDDEGMAIKFTLVTRNGLGGRMYAPTTSASRADDCYDDLAGTAAENYIDMADCQLILFDGDKKLLRRIYPEEKATSDDKTTYTVQVEITDAYFTEKVRNGEDVSFYIMAVANTASLSGQQIALTPGQTIAQLAEQGRSFEQPEGYNDEAGNFHPWTPSTADKRLIPMAGFRGFTVTAAALRATSFDVPLDISTENATSGVKKGGEINMLRALSKIEIVDKIDITGTYDGDDSRRPRIDKVELYGYYNRGAILPIVEGSPTSTKEGEILWGAEASGQVITPTIPASASYVVPDPEKPSTISFSFDAAATEDREDRCKVYSGYIVEYRNTGIAETTLPYIQINLQNPNEEDNASPNFNMQLANYADGKPTTPLEALLRNHIYRFEITGVSSDVNIISLNYMVCNWSNYTVDIPTFE